jgi:putative DNA primase/helicase
MCIDTIFSDTHWISFNGKLYQWVGTHYQKACRVKARKRIVNWCDTTPVETKTGWKYAYADATHVENIWKWVLEYFEVAPEQINPPGINCLNGVVKINWNNGVASWELVPHDPEVIYTYVSEFNFDPDADSTQCDRMLSCLEPEQQQLFIQTMAASLDLATIRKYRGRTVKALLCKGDGNNGKDTLREAVRLLFGEIGMSDATIGDFKAYDNGRKFDLAKLEGTRINWSSENSSYDELDRIESLKKAITGESLDMERKGVDSHTMNLSTVFLFNVNETPNLKAGLEAIQSRWAVLNFDKTYKVNADPSKGELEADSRFRYDPYFIKEQVCPALLNKMLKALKNLAVNGLDYSCTEQALQDIQKETNHLWAFAQDMGLEYQTGSKIYINDLWESLREWYINNGTLEIVATDKGKEKKIWHDQPRRGDRNVKAPNQIYQRFAELFPKIKKQREKKDSQRKGQFYLTDISFSEANRIASEATVKQSVKHQTQSQSENEANEVKNSITQAKKIIGELNKSEQKALISWLTAIEKSESNCSTANKNLSANKNSAKGEKIASPASPLDTVSVTASPTASLTASPDEITASLITKKHFASLSSTVDREGVTTSTNGSRSESLTFEIGSSVANNNPEKNSYNWHGTIVGFDGDGADVRWDERKGMKGGQVLWHNLSELRLL